jgi:hypothetical protein
MILKTQKYDTIYKAVKTLKLLYASHTRSGKELQRRINSPPARHRQPSQIDQRFENRPPEQFPAKLKAIHLYSNQVVSATPSDSMLGSQQFFVGQAVDSAIMNQQTNFRGNFEPLNMQGPAILSPDPSQSASIAQSYMILDKNLHEYKVFYYLIQDVDEEDPFNKFWDAVEGLVQKISGPVAFTSAPLGKQDEIRNLLYHNQVDTSTTGKSDIFNSYMVVPPAESRAKHR